VPYVEAPATGKYTVAGNVLTTDIETAYGYCASGNTMTWTPQGPSPTIVGSVVFEKAGGGGSGGQSGTGGSTVTSSGGKGGAGGGTGQGGAGGGTGQGGAGGSSGRDAGTDAPVGSGGAVTGGSTGSGGAAGAGGSTSTVDGPCDIYAGGNTPCVAAYSMIRVLSRSYAGPLYQVRKGGGSKNTGTGGTTTDIGAKDGFADSAAQDAFCGSETCTVSILYDQSGKKNDLTVSKKGCYTGTASEDDYESSAVKKSVTVGGHKVYGLYMNTHEGYRNNDSTTMPANGALQGMYEVADGKHATGYCCWDFGTASKDNCYTAGVGSMNALFFGGYIAWGKGAGNGPWFMADFEAGIWAGGSGASNYVNPNSPSMAVDYAFGTLKTSSTNYAIRVGNAQSGSLTTTTDGNLPFKTWIVKGGIILGTGGDNSNSGTGTFYEGAILAGRPTDQIDDAVFKNVQDAKYGQ
jgi:hypothetical protein